MNAKTPKQMTPEVAISNISRRRLLQGFALSGLVLAVGVPGVLLAGDEPEKFGRDAMPHGWTDDPLVFVAIMADGTVKIVCHRAEMGQGVRTSLPMVVADELGADWAQVEIVQAPGDEPKYGNQNTDGSRSMRHFFMPMRNVGAAARMMLEAAAAAHWGVAVAEVKTGVHEVLHPQSGRSLGFGELAEAASKLEVPERDQLQLKTAEQFRYIGKGKTHLVDGLDMVSGKAIYGIDVTLPDMLHAVVARPPVLGGKVVDYDATEALKIPGVLKVVTIPGSPPPAYFNPLGGVAVIATNTWAALQGRKALKITWDHGEHASYNSPQFRAEMEQSARVKGGAVVRDEGDVYRALENASQTFSAEYYLPHLSQAPMEPPVATARIVDGHCELWAPVQDPQAGRDLVARWLELEADKVTVNVTLLGGGFGRKSKPDYMVEAAWLSRIMDGQAVKVTWTREDDLHHSYFHTVSVERIEAGVDADGKPVAWLHRTVAPTILSTFDDSALVKMPIELGMGVVNVPFAIDNVRIENPEAKAHTRIGWFRSVSNVPHAFAIQSFVSEMAAKLDRDAKDYLLEVIGPPRQLNPAKLLDSWNYGESPEEYPIDTGRLRRVVETVADKASWGKSLPAGRGQGIAAHYSFVSYTAAVVEVEVDEDGELSIPRVDIAIDCGPAINPERIKSQLEGAVIMGISLAMLGEITFKDGAVEQNNFDGYQLSRMADAPAEIHVHIVPADDYDVPLGGVGEPGLPPIAPALCNAIFAATGQRIRALPIADQLEPA